MEESFYGRIAQTQNGDVIAAYAEEIVIRGFTIVRDLLPAGDLTRWRERIDSVYKQQEVAFGREALIAIQELDLCRAPLLHDFDFVKLATHPVVLSVAKTFLGDWFILNLQNAIINRPNETHHQSSWHRDLPHQNWVISRPLGISALFAIDDFSAETGGTHVIPYSHKLEVLPSDSYIAANQVIISAPAGSAILFDPMLFHRAGANRSKVIRRAVNHLYTTPILKQQYDFPRALGDRPDLGDEYLRLLGYTSQVPTDDRVWREARVARNLKAE